MARTYRTSSLPLLLTCPAAQIEPAVRVFQSSPQARDGTAAHELLRGLPETGQVAWGALEAVCERHQADPAEVRLLVGNGVAMWGDLAPMFAGGVAESELRLERGDLVLTGHTDLLAFRTEEGGLARSDGTMTWTRQLARILDWKGGRLDADYRWQMQGYCALVLHNFPELDEATATVIWLREREIENYTMTREAMPNWVLLVSDSLQWDGRSYVPGSQCQYCPRSHECPARLALVHEAATVVRSSDRPNLSTMTADNIIALYDEAGEVERLAKRVREAIRTRVLWQGDVEGSTHALRSSKERRRVLDPREAWPVLEGCGFSEHDFAQCLTMHAPEVERIIRERAPYRKKTQAVRELREALIEKGALTEVEFRKVSKRRV